MGNMLNILVVDDELDAGELFRQKFRKEVRKGEVRLEIASSGNEALQILGDFHKETPLLILSDINMPGMTGIQLLEKIKKLYPGLPVYMVSAYGGNEEYVRQAKDLGAEDFISKPVDFNQLKEMMGSYSI